MELQAAIVTHTKLLQIAQKNIESRCNSHHWHTSEPVMHISIHSVALWTRHIHTSTDDCIFKSDVQP